jgi:geranylgeranylglycerol-phosphate geranylgeranyltransferase
MKSFMVYLELARPLNVVIAAVSVLVGALSAGVWPVDGTILLACLVAALVTAGANAVNDLYDVDIDRVNKPHRPLPSGRLNKGQAIGLAAVLTIAGLAVSPALGPWGFLIALLVVLLLVAYSARLKRTVLWGNLAVALAAALAFVYGGLAVGRIGPALIPAGFAFLFHLGREILKDAQDVAGDRAGGARTLPAVAGVGEALGWTSLVFILLIMVMPLPFVTGYYSFWYIIIVVLGVDLPLIHVILSSRRYQSPDHLGSLSLLLKLDMWVGLAAIMVGVWL